MTNEPKVMESLLLSVGHTWSRRETVDQQVELIGRHFSQGEMLANLKELMELVGLPAPVKRQPTAARTATKAQAGTLAATRATGGAESWSFSPAPPTQWRKKPVSEAWGREWTLDQD